MNFEVPGPSGEVIVASSTTPTIPAVDLQQGLNSPPLEQENVELIKHQRPPLADVDGILYPPSMNILRQQNGNSFREKVAAGGGVGGDVKEKVTPTKSPKTERSASLECVALIDVDRMAMDEEDSW